MMARKLIVAGAENVAYEVKEEIVRKGGGAPGRETERRRVRKNRFGGKVFQATNR
jgi:hypothetical protein